MNLRITITFVFILINLFSCTVNAQYYPELNMITINLEKENMMWMNETEIKNLLNNKIENDWNIIMSKLNNEYQIPIRIMIYIDQELIYVSTFYNKEKLSDEINAIVCLLNLS